MSENYRGKALTFLNAHPNQVFTAHELAAEIGCSLKQAQGVIYNLRSTRDQRPGVDYRTAITVVSSGQAWLYDPSKLSAAEPVEEKHNGRRIFEEIGPVRDGGIIVQAEDGTLWRATAL